MSLLAVNFIVNIKYSASPRAFMQKRLLSNRAIRNSKFLQNSPNAVLNKSILERYRHLKTPENLTQASYAWVDLTGEKIRMKARYLDKENINVDELPHWSTPIVTKKSAGDLERNLVPRAIYRDPFKPGKNNIIVLCDTYHADGSPTDTNKRAAFQEAIEKVREHEPWFSIKQEYTFLDVNGHPFGWPVNGLPAPEGPYYCGVGADRVYARDLVEAHAIACLYAGVDFRGTNAEVMPSKWRYKIGLTTGIKSCDDIWVSRYILQRIAEEYGIVVTFNSKPLKGQLHGAHAYIKFSTKAMRADGGIKAIEQAIEKLSKCNERYIKVYGSEESHMEFSWGVAKRAVSVRIPGSVANAGKGYLEDRRPSSNCDPYAVCGALVNSCLLVE